MELNLNQILPDFEKPDEAKDFFKSLGVVTADDLSFLTENDLLSFFNLIQARRIVQFGKTHGK